jgi:hypothetical protein
MIIRARLLALGTVATAVLSLPALAEDYDREQHGVHVAANEGHDHGKEGHDHGHEDKSHYDAKTFATVKEAWAFLGTATAEAEKLAADGKLEPIHELAEQIGAAVHTLEDKSDMVSGDAKSKLTAALKQLDKAADELHHSAEGKDADATSLNLKKVKGLLPLIQGLYPAGAL